MNDIKKVVGDNIRKYRKSSNMTQEDLAFEVNIRPQTLSGIENGHSYPSASLIAKLAKGLGVPVACLFVIDSEFNKLGQNKAVMMLGDAITKLDSKKQKIAVKAIEFISQTDLD